MSGEIYKDSTNLLADEDAFQSDPVEQVVQSVPKTKSTLVLDDANFPKKCLFSLSSLFASNAGDGASLLSYTPPRGTELPDIGDDDVDANFSHLIFAQPLHVYEA